MLVTMNKGTQEANASLLIIFSVPHTFHIFLLIPPAILEVDINSSILERRKLELRKTKTLAYMTQLVSAEPGQDLIPIGLPSEPMFAPLQDATFAEEGILGHNYLAHTYSALPPFHRSEKKVGRGHIRRNCLRHAAQWWPSWGWPRNLQCCQLDAQKPGRCCIFCTAKGKDIYPQSKSANPQTTGV